MARQGTTGQNATRCIAEEENLLKHATALAQALYTAFGMNPRVVAGSYQTQPCIDAWASFAGEYGDLAYPPRARHKKQA